MTHATRTLERVREHAVPCAICRRSTFEVDGLCRRGRCHDLARQARTLGTSAAGELLDWTFTDLDRWARTGILGRHLDHQGSGHPRRWRDADLEAAWALRELLAIAGDLGARQPPHRRMLDLALEAVRARRVDPAGEILVYDPTIEHAYRVPLDGPLDLEIALTVLHLRAFRGLEPVPWPT